MKLLTIGQVSKLINRTPRTIKHWYNWAEENGKLNLLPEIIIKDEKGTRYFKEDDIEMFETFKSQITYGMMSEYNKKNWGKRGKEIERRKEEK